MNQTQNYVLAALARTNDTQGVDHLSTPATGIEGIDNGEASLGFLKTQVEQGRLQEVTDDIMATEAGLQGCRYFKVDIPSGTKVVERKLLASDLNDEELKATRVFKVNGQPKMFARDVNPRDTKTAHLIIEDQANGAVVKSWRAGRIMAPSAIAHKQSVRLYSFNG